MFLSGFLIIVAVIAYFLYPLKFNRSLIQKPRSPVKSLVQNNLSYQSIQTLVAEQPTESHLNDELLEIEKEPRCWSDLDDELQKECPQSECVFENLKKRRSWASDFFDDGWKNKSETLQQDQRTPLGLSLYALGKAGLLSGREIEENLTDAARLLKELSSDDPKNSYPLLFLAEIYRRQGQPDMSEELLKKATAPGMQFNSYLKELVKELSLNNLGSASEILAATGIWSNTPIPDFLTLRELIAAHPEYAQNVASQLVFDGLNAEVLSEMEWVPIEYSVGYALFSKHGSGEGVLPFSKQLESRPNSVLQFSSPDCRQQINDYLAYLRKL